ncbi:MAG: DUF4956 domain-containing protein [Brevefilum sp.]|nr:DUF4956 domain-containing protein [Brevefilum sp.]MDT8382415.1 DUF4956 domain-containing protein [Brevefilum sp.]MDW7753929.1 DUF4956 domain-containing protein [Brevefilum sp.]
MWDEIINIIQRAFASMALTSEDIFNIIFSLIVSIIIGLVISQTYKLTHRGVNFESTFMTSLVMLAPIVAVVMFFIQGNLVLSLGLVGSISIIRFRTPIKDTRDMVYLFWVIAVGLGTGTYHWGIVIISSLAILALIVILYFLNYGQSQNHDYILIISGGNQLEQEAIKTVLNQYTTNPKIRSQTINKDSWEVVYELHLAKIDPVVDKLLKDLNNIESISNVSLLAPQLALPA